MPASAIAAAAMAIPRTRPRRWAGSSRPRRRPAAYTAATAKPVTTYVETSVCGSSVQVDGLSAAASGSTWSRAPRASSWKPAGVFIQELVITTNRALAAPLTAMGMEVSQWATGPSRSQPVRAVEVEAEEDRLQEEREALGREGQSDHRARQRHEARPEQAQLEGEDGARDGAHGEEDPEGLGPAPGQQPPLRVPAPQRQ